MPEGQWPRGVTPRLRSGAAAESARLRWRRNGQEELPHVQGRGGGGREELPSVRGQGPRREELPCLRGQARPPGQNVSKLKFLPGVVAQTLIAERPLFLVCSF